MVSVQEMASAEKRAYSGSESSLDSEWTGEGTNERETN